MGSGLRFMLWPYVQKKNAPAVSVLFTISPSVTNYRPTLDTFRTAKAMAGLKIKAVKVVKQVSAEDIILNLKSTIREQEMTIRKLRAKVDELSGNSKLQKTMRKMNNEGVVGAHIEVCAADGITQEKLIDAGVEEKEDGAEKRANVEYNLKDLEEQRVNMLFVKKEMKTRLRGDKKNELLRKEYKAILKELDHVKEKIDGIKKLEENMEKAITKDRIPYSNSNDRISMFLIDQFGGLMDAIEDVDDESVRIRKSDLMEMKKGLQGKKQESLEQCVMRLDELCHSHGDAEQREAIKLNEFIIAVSGHEYIPTLRKNLLFEASVSGQIHYCVIMFFSAT